MFNLFGKPSIVTRIQLFSDFSSKVVFDPPEPPSDQLIQLALMYGAKLRWLLNNEPIEIKEMLVSFSELAISNWVSAKPGELASNIKNELKSRGLGADTTATIPIGETFTVKYYHSASGWGHITNYLPKPRGMVINLAWHYIVLLEEIHSQLFSRGENSPLIQLMMFWMREQQLDPKFDGKGLNTLKLLNEVAKVAYFGGIRDEKISN